MQAELKDQFLIGYLACALWSSNSDEADEYEFFDQKYSIYDFSDEGLTKAIEDCSKFQKENEELLNQTGRSEEENGHDFWLTRNGHGTGFWDRDNGEVGKKLTEQAKKYRELHLFVDANNKVDMD
jgi:hypothetical protein